MSKFVAEDIRSARPEDAHIVRSLVRSAYAKWVPVIGREPLPIVADYDRAVRDRDELVRILRRLAVLGCDDDCRRAREAVLVDLRDHAAKLSVDVVEGA